MSTVVPSALSEPQLPQLGGAGGGILTSEQEYKLGQQWLRIYRSRVATTDDPVIQSYVEDIVARMLTNSELIDRRVEVVVAENPTLNAFAVPGGIVGVHTGLFDYALTEEQFASVIAHELAHLSQKHFLRSIEKQQNATLPTLAAYIAGIIIAASGGADAGLAVISATQATAIDAQLRFSRKMEQEADRVGMNTLIKAGMDPHAMPDMFSQMLKSKRFSSAPPEFLLTHPLTESRLSDAKLRAQQYPQRYYPPQIDYEIARIHASRTVQQSPQDSIKRFTLALQGNEYSEDGARYGLLMGLIDAKRFDEAKQQLELLLGSQPDIIAFHLAHASLLSAQGRHNEAVDVLQTQLQRLPKHHALNVRLAETLMKSGRYEECESVLSRHVKRRPKDDYVWYLLAEAHGLAGNIFDVHEARAEYFILNGLYDKAEIQLVNALELVKKDDRQTRARVEHRLRQTREFLESNS